MLVLFRRDRSRVRVLGLLTRVRVAIRPWCSLSWVEAGLRLSSYRATRRIRSVRSRGELTSEKVRIMVVRMLLLVLH